MPRLALLALIVVGVPLAYPWLLAILATALIGMAWRSYHRTRLPPAEARPSVPGPSLEERVALRSAWSELNAPERAAGIAITRRAE